MPVNFFTFSLSRTIVGADPFGQELSSERRAISELDVLRKQWISMVWLLWSFFSLGGIQIKAVLRGHGEMSINGCVQVCLLLPVALSGSNIQTRFLYPPNSADVLCLDVVHQRQ